MNIFDYVAHVHGCDQETANEIVFEAVDYLKGIRNVSMTDIDNVLLYDLGIEADFATDLINLVFA